MGWGGNQLHLMPLLLHHPSSSCIASICAFSNTTLRIRIRRTECRVQVQVGRQANRHRGRVLHLIKGRKVR